MIVLCDCQNLTGKFASIIFSTNQEAHISSIIQHVIKNKKYHILYPQSTFFCYSRISY